MSNEYPIGHNVSVGEQSLLLDFMIDTPCTGFPTTSLAFTVEEFRTAIIKQIEALSYFSDNPEEVLRRFNVNYGQTE
ncbi:MAG: hypothetical protein RSE62_03465 [Citrobacter sp.]